MNKYDKFNDMKVDLNEFNITPKDEESFKINDIEKKKILNSIKGKKKKIWKKIATVAVAAVFGLVVFGQTNMGKEVYAKTKEFVLETFNFKQEEAFDSKAELDKYAQHIDKTIYGGDYKIKTSSVMLYGNELNITFLIEYDKEQNENHYIQGLWMTGMKIGDKDIDITKSGGGGGPIKENPKVQSDVFQYILTDDEVKLLEDSKKITLNGDGLALKVNGVPEVHGEKFEIVLDELDLENLKEQSEIIDLDIKLRDEENNVNYRITGYEYNPYKTKIYAELDEDVKNRDNESHRLNSREISLDGELNNGKKVHFNGHYTSDENYQPTDKIIFEIDMYQYEDRNGIVSMEELKDAKEITLNFNIVEEDLVGNVSEEEKDKVITQIIERHGDEFAKELDLENLTIAERNKRIKEILVEDLKTLDKSSNMIVRDENIGEPFTIKLK
ncbi:DUF4179 domain-containing protein [Miniphocaeibacter halophilus]|uniref:DUF4179 domain-containing protein n=1 Tax=Miniphocaeibacter halophilus TaxID=2931922 RepID=A0AC61MZ41_9FIRM|nr:DUF4179 domain-containing protein [Miniphocaeibacter halophilus]QQK08494.1 DUF4179 domain-containing protein [Miniphocaeibacter halophilus]